MLDDANRMWAEGLLGGPLQVVRGLREGGSPWLVELSRKGATRAVLRIAGSNEDELTRIRVEEMAQRQASAAGLAVPRVLGARYDDSGAALLTEFVEGADSTIPVAPTPALLAQLGATAARVHATQVSAGLPRRARSLESIDFAAIRADAAPHPLLVEAERRLARLAVPEQDVGFVHGDLWQGNMLWRDSVVAAVVDWDFAGIGPAGADLGSVRCDAALAFGGDAPDAVLAGWEEQAGREARDVAYWDAVTALNTPPDVGWFVDAYAGQGRTDLTQEAMLERRDTFLEDALSRLG